MCSIAWAAFALSAGSSVMQYQQASASAKVQTALHNINQKSALSDMNSQMVDANTRQLQEQQKAAEDMAARRRQQIADTATARAALGDRGVTGFTMASLLGQIAGDAGRDITSIQTNRDWSLAQVEREKEGIRSQAISRMGSTAPGVRPSGLATALQIGAAGLSAYSDFKAGKFGDNKLPWQK